MYNAETTMGTVLGLVYPTDCPTTGTNIHCMLSSTMSETGVDINIPSGVQQINLMFCNDDSQTLMTMPDYQIMLTFELYN